MLALGHASRFDRKIAGIRYSDGDPLFSPKAKLRSLGFNYPALLKLAIIVRRGGDRNAAMMEFIDWMYFRWQFSAPATLFACIVLGKSPPANAFKGLLGTDRQRALRGVWNAAWDMVYVQEWFGRVTIQGEENKVHVLCSRDVLLHKVADLLRKSMFEYESAGELLRIAGFGKRVANLYEDRCRSLGSSGRASLPWPEDFNTYRRKLLAGLKKEFLMPGTATIR